jgi:hypothetical protein
MFEHADRFAEYLPHLRAVGPRGHHLMMTKQLICAAVMTAVSVVIAAPAIAGADPTPYQIQGPSGPVYGGLRSLPPICGVQPRACAGNWNPDTGAWDFP